MRTLSVMVPVRDERQRLPAFLAMLEAQTRRPDEVMLVDGMSVDGSREWLAEAGRSRPWLRVLDNPRQVVPAALNVGLAASTGSLLARMDTHADYAPDYLEVVSGFLAAHPEVDGVGGAMQTEGRGAWGKAIAATLRRPFGLGGARHRVGGTAGPVEHVFTGCYRRAALVAVGGWDERLLANEDFEADTRLRESGHTVWLHPAARSTWYVRESVPGLARQMFRYGFYKAATVRLHPGSLRLRQVAPPVLVAGLGASVLARPRLGLSLTGAYLAAGALLGASAARSAGADPLRGAVVPPLVHLSWGAGFLAGAVRLRRTLAPRRP